MQKFNLDISAKRIIPLLNVKQRDVGTKILVNITDNGEAYPIPEDAVWSVWFSGPSGKGNYTAIDGESAFAVEGNTVTVELIVHMLNNPGLGQMSLVMNSMEGVQLGLWNIPYYVECLPGANGSAAENYYTAFHEDVIAAQNAATEAENAAGRAGWAAEQAHKFVADAENAAKGVEICHFGYRYADADPVYDLNDEGTVKLYLFPNGGGYDAVVAGEGEMANHPYHYDGNGALVVDLSGRRFDASKIFRLHIEGSVKSIGDCFMYKAFNLKHLTFGDSKAVTHLGAYAFAYTQISGEYDFSGLQDSTISNAFEACPKLEGLTFSEKVTTIAVKAFQFCLNLRYVHGLAKVTEIGEAAFQYCTCLESIDVVPGNVTLGNWAFILTPNEAKVEGTETALKAAAWKSAALMPFVQNQWAEDVSTPTEERPTIVSLSVPETDNQKADMYKGDWKVFWTMVYLGDDENGEPVWFSGRASPTGQCGFFCLYHIYNILHPNAPYASYHDFIDREISPVRLDVSEKMAYDLRNTDAERWTELVRLNTEAETGVTYEAGTTVSATDLPLALDNASATYGDEGTAFWGVCEALGWTAKEINFDEEENSGTNVKEKILQELAAGHPVMMEIVGASNAGHGAHAVTAIGYDKDTDKLQIIDSTWEYPSDIVPMVYWLPFEALITPDAASAAWTFDFGEVITMTQIDEGLKLLLKQVNSGFRVESGVYEQTADAEDATNSVPVTVACSEGAKLFVFQADDDTYNAISADALAKYTAGSTVTKWTLGFAGQGKSALYTGQNQLRGQLTFADIYAAYKMFKAADQTMKCWNTDVGGFKFNTLAMKAGKYNWTAYYWNE